MSESHEKKILIIAGEASGDLLGAHLAKTLKTFDPTLHLSGMGGQQMREAGVDIFIDADKLAVVGAFEVIKHLGDILAAMRVLKHRFAHEKPDLVIFIDYPGFNLRMARQAKKAGIKVLYYVSPQIWAWRYNRIKKIRKNVDRMAVLLSFEEKIYQKENVPVSFVGHPLVDIATPTVSRETVYSQFNLDPNKPIVALFPGSRHHEVNRLLPIMVDAAKLIRARIPDVQFVLPLAPNLSIENVCSFLSPDIRVIQHNTYNVLSVCDAAIAVSGTVTLEIALQKVPLVIIYKMAPFSYWLGTKLIDVPFIGLCNLVAEERVALELIQKTVTPEAIANEICRLLNDDDYRQSLLTKLATVRSKLGGGDASRKVAQLALDLL